MRKIILLLVVISSLLTLTIPAFGDSFTLAVPYAAAGFYLFDYEHSLNENSAVNLTGMCMADLSPYNSIFNVDSSYKAVDVSYKYYPGQSQNGLYCGANVLIIQNSQYVPGHEAGYTYNLLGGSIGIRRIGEYSYTYDYGIIAYYDPDEQGLRLMLRLNMGYGW